MPGSVSGIFAFVAGRSPESPRFIDQPIHVDSVDLVGIDVGELPGFQDLRPSLSGGLAGGGAIMVPEVRLIPGFPRRGLRCLARGHFETGIVGGDAEHPEPVLDLAAIGRVIG